MLLLQIYLIVILALLTLVVCAPMIQLCHLEGSGTQLPSYPSAFQYGDLFWCLRAHISDRSPGDAAAAPSSSITL